ncbi:MAG: hypothetical protein H7Y17_11165 [Chlorobia bacterium]|nr:hypothetical protein [Fimbriimonadaceae bacterium]
MKMAFLASFGLGGLALLAGCTKSEVTNADINNLDKTHTQDSYEDAMKKAGRGAELEEQKRIAAERGQGR